MKNNNNKSLEEILTEKLNYNNLINTLSDTPPYLLNPILIEAASRRTSKITPQQLLKNYDSKADFFGISSFSQKDLLNFTNKFYEILPNKFESVELSPICPLGTNSVITNLSQKKILSTTRISEVIGDPTTSLILECASRKKKLSKIEGSINERIDLATCHRVLRMQPFDKSKGYMQHFDLFGIVTSIKTSDYFGFISRILLEHLTIWLEFINHLNKDEFLFQNISINISNMHILERLIKFNQLDRNEIAKRSGEEDFDFISSYNLDFPKETSSINEIEEEIIEKYNLKKVINQAKIIEDEVINKLKVKYPKIKVCFDFNRIAGIGYYKDYCLHIYSENYENKRVQLSDGGAVNYIEKLISDNKECAFTSGFGAELIHKIFKKPNKSI